MKKFFLPFIIAFVLCSCSKKETALELNVMSFNVRYDNPDDGENNWKFRKNIAAQVVLDSKIDILGTQEVLVNQMEDMKQRLPKYQAIGVGREDGIEKGEYSAIFYKKERFEELQSGYFWLSETPESVGSKGWDAACERIATWVILKDTKSKQDFFVLNTHFDHVGKQARRNSVELILNKTYELSKGLPVVVIGDFNASPDSEIIKEIVNPLNPKHLIDSKEIAVKKEGVEWTFHDFGQLDIKKRKRIDYIFVDKKAEVKSYIVLPEKMNDIFLSDHMLIFAQLVIKK